MQPHRENEDEDEQRNDRESGGRMPTLDWRNRDEAMRAAAGTPLHILREVPEMGVGAGDAVSDRVGPDRTRPETASPNLLVHGDNLAALKALLPFAAGTVKCIYIDPPYNTGSAFEHYDDNLEHSTWLSLLYPRLQLLREFLSEDGSIWISIDDDEQAYLKVLCDEIFGRQNFVATICWQKRTSPDMRSAFSDGHDFILLYAKNSDQFKQTRNKLPLSEKQRKAYKNPDFDPRGPWTSADYTATGFRPNQMYKITTPGGVEYYPPKGVCWKNVEEVFKELVNDNRIWFGEDGKNMPRRKTFLSEHEGVTPWTWWSNEEVGHNQEAKKEIVALFGAPDAFETPKPERLIQRILQIATNPGDLVLDSFLGSGTTAAVAHKMGRRWIGVEMGEHARTHCAVRLRKVIEGEQGGISKAVGWKGGGSFRFLELGEELLDGNGAIRESIPWEVLAAHVWWKETKTGWMNVASYSSHLPMTPQGPLENGNIGTGNTSTVATLKRSPVLGVKDGVAYALLYNGILKDRRVDGGNVLTKRTLALIRDDLGSASFDSLVVYAEWSKLGAEALAAERIVLKQTPYDLNDRK